LKKGDQFKRLWGEKAGWAQTIMFIDDLKGFQGSKDMTDSNKKNSLNVKREASFEECVKVESLEVANGVDDLKGFQDSKKMVDSTERISLNVKREASFEDCMKVEALEVANAIEVKIEKLKKRSSKDMCQSPASNRHLKKKKTQKM